MGMMQKVILIDFNPFLREQSFCLNTNVWGLANMVKNFSPRIEFVTAWEKELSPLSNRRIESRTHSYSYDPWHLYAEVGKSIASLTLEFFI